DPEALGERVAISDAALRHLEDNVHLIGPLFEKGMSLVSKKMAGKPAMKYKTLVYFMDRIVHGAQSNILITKDSPTYSYVDMASVNRANLELAANFVALLREEDDELYAAFIVEGQRNDRIKAKELKEWSEHPDERYLTTAKPMQCDYAAVTEKRVSELLKSLKIEKPKMEFPRIEKRFRLAGEKWRFLYTSRYRELCSWSHCHPEEVFFSPSNRFDFDNELRGVDKGIEMLHFSHHLIFLLLESIFEICGEDDSDLTNCQIKLMGEFCRIVKPILDPELQKAA
ncbi:MAG: DUF5677 domain-containing protein, partial [Verrucomicrobiota bacterium]